MPAIDPYFRAVIERGASDIHVSAECPVYLRVKGELKPLDERRLPAAEAAALFSEVLGGPLTEKLGQTLEVDTAYTLDTGDRFRINAFRERQGWSLVARHFSKTIRTVEELGLPAILNRFADRHQGLILVTGPGRSGKSTTAAALVTTTSTPTARTTSSPWKTPSSTCIRANAAW